MPKPIIFLPEALVEASEAYAWYEEKEIGLGEDFYRALSVALTYAARNPDTPIKVFKNYRKYCCAGSPTQYFSSTPRKPFLSPLYSTVPRTRKSG